MLTYCSQMLLTSDFNTSLNSDSATASKGGQDNGEGCCQESCPTRFHCGFFIVCLLASRTQCSSPSCLPEMLHSTLGFCLWHTKKVTFKQHSSEVGYCTCKIKKAALEMFKLKDCYCAFFLNLSFTLFSSWCVTNEGPKSITQAVFHCHNLMMKLLHIAALKNDFG